MTTPVLVGAIIGFVVGFALAAEVGRIIYNRKMDEIQTRVREVQALVGTMKEIRERLEKVAG